VITGTTDGSADVDAFADTAAEVSGDGTPTAVADAVAPAVGAADVIAPTIEGVATAISAELAEASFAALSNRVVVGLSFFEFGSAVRANETPTPPTSTATAVAATVKVFLLMFCNRLMMFSFEHLEHLLPLQEQPQRNARRV
jgi:hypothetical protein